MSRRSCILESLLEMRRVLVSYIRITGERISGLGKYKSHGGWYHLMNWGIEQRVIYLDDRDRFHFFELMEKLLERYGIEVHAY